MKVPEGYTGLIAEKLTVEHYQQLSDRGFTDIEISQIVNDGLRSVTPQQAADLGYVSKKGKEYLDCGGWAYIHKSGFVQFRPDDLEKYSKYLNPTGYKAAIAIAEGAQWVTEGIFDAYFIRFRGGIPCGIAAGVSHYKAAPENSGISWLFDADGWVNPQVFTNLIHAAKHTGGKVQLFPKVTEKGKDGAQEYFEAGKTEQDFKALLQGAYTAEQLCFELPKHWTKLPEIKVLECTNALIKLGVEILDRIQQDRLWTALARASKLPKKTIQGLAAQAFFDSPEGKQKLAEKKAAQEEAKCDFLQVRQLIEDACNGELRLNQLKQCIEYKRLEINPGRYKTFVAELINKDVPREDCIEILGAIAEANAYHPVQEYLERVYAQYGDDTRHLLKDAGCRLFNPKQNLEIYNTYLRKWMIGAVARIYEPGCKFDHVLILQGPQGRFKSTVLETLAGGEFFDDNLGDLASLKDELLILHMAWIQEWAEFDRVTGKREASLIKSFVTRKEDRFRAPYDRAVTSHKRRSVLCGSVNDDSFLIDDENRRFWVIPLGAPADIETARAERDKLWAAAVSFYRKDGELPTLTVEEAQENAKLNRSYQREDTWEALIMDWIETPGNLKRTPSGSEPLYFTTGELLEGALKMAPEFQTEQNQNRVKRILKRMGCESVKVRLDRGLQSKSNPERAWRCPATWRRDERGTDAGRLENQGIDPSCPAVPSNSLEEQELGKNSSNGHKHDPKKNVADAGKVEGDRGTAGQGNGTLEPVSDSGCPANGSASVPLGMGGTALSVGDYVRIPAGDGILEAIDGDSASVRLHRDGTLQQALLRLTKKLQGAIA